PEVRVGGRTVRVRRAAVVWDHRLHQRIGRGQERRLVGVNVGTAELLVQAGLLQVGENRHGPTPIAGAVDIRQSREVLVGVVVVVQRQADLLEVVLALDTGGGLTHLLHRRHEQGDQDRDDRDHHQQLDQRERRAMSRRALQDGNLRDGHKTYYKWG